MESRQKPTLLGFVRGLLNIVIRPDRENYNPSPTFPFSISFNPLSFGCKLFATCDRGKGGARAFRSSLEFGEAPDSSSLICTQFFIFLTFTVRQRIQFQTQNSYQRS